MTATQTLDLFVNTRGNQERNAKAGLEEAKAGD